MEPGQLIYARLSSSFTVAGLLGYVHETLGQQYRIYPVIAPQGIPRPYVVYQLISDAPDGSALCALDDVARVQVSIFADSYSAVCAIGKAIRKELHYYETAGAYLEMVNQQDHESPDAICFFRSQDYQVEHDPDAEYAPELSNDSFDYAFPVLLS